MASCGVYQNGGMSEVIPLPEGGFAAIPPMEKAGLQPGYARIP